MKSSKQKSFKTTSRGTIKLRQKSTLQSSARDLKLFLAHPHHPDQIISDRLSVPDYLSNLSDPKNKLEPKEKKYLGRVNFRQVENEDTTESDSRLAGSGLKFMDIKELF